MPTLTKVLTATDLQGRSILPGVDLAPYLDLLHHVLSEGVGATLTLTPGERRRTEKRRLSLAARQMGYLLVWRLAPEGQLRFVLARPGERVPGSRPRRPRAERKAEQTIIDAVMTEDVAEVTGTTAAEEASPPPRVAPARRGRRRPA